MRIHILAGIAWVHLRRLGATLALGVAIAAPTAQADLLGRLNEGRLNPTPSTASFSGTIEYQGLARNYLGIRPQPATVNAPVLILLHAHGVTPQTMANLTRAGRLAQQYGAWVFLPEGENDVWNEDPSSSDSTDDVGFISKLIDTAVSQYGIDRNRVYAAGYSNGGFMAQRLGCQLSGKIAGFVSVAASLRHSLASVCAPQRAVPAALMLGTSDMVVPYNGDSSVQSASTTTAFWAAKNACAAGQKQTTAMPTRVNDGTSVTLTKYTACPATAAAELYTVNGGGHTWPGSPYGYLTMDLGRTSKNLDATIELWKFLTPYSLH